jgi:hypothetical protein
VAGIQVGGEEFRLCIRELRRLQWLWLRGAIIWRQNKIILKRYGDSVVEKSDGIFFVLLMNFGDQAGFF